MRPVDVAPDAVADCAPDADVREEVVGHRVARQAHGRCKPISSDLNRAPSVIFVSDDRCESPSARGVTRRERVSAVEELRVRIVMRGARALRDVLEYGGDQPRVYQSLAAEQSGIPCACVPRRTTDE